jgi:hypothetical protein
VCASVHRPYWISVRLSGEEHRVYEHLLIRFNVKVASQSESFRNFIRYLDNLDTTQLEKEYRERLKQEEWEPEIPEVDAGEVGS